ncbi:MAG: hypothetical protein U0L76_00465 [Ruminococcus sp.]|nr:hypothetical protein [Ruminococcus sp.]
MSKKSSKKNEQYPVELPSRNSESKSSPIVDVVNNETYPLEVGARHHSGVHIESFDNIAEVVATEIEPDTAEQTTHGQQM